MSDSERATGTTGTTADTSDAKVYYDRDPASALASKVRWCKRFALLETVFYVVLIPMMVKHFILHEGSSGLDLARKVTSYFHGMVVTAFAYMAWDIRRLLKWSWPFFAFALLPVGSLFAHARLRQFEATIPAPAGQPR